MSGRAGGRAGGGSGGGAGRVGGRDRSLGEDVTREGAAWRDVGGRAGVRRRPRAGDGQGGRAGLKVGNSIVGNSIAFSTLRLEC